MSIIISNELKRYNHLIGEIGAAYHEISLKLGLSDSAMNILYTILEHGGECPLQEICRLSGLSKQTINSSVRKLESEGIVRLELRNSENRKTGEASFPWRKKVCLTEKGQIFAEQTAGQVLQIENDIFASWPQEDVLKYIQLTETYLLALRSKSPNHSIRNRQ